MALRFFKSKESKNKTSVPVSVSIPSAADDTIEQAVMRIGSEYLKLAEKNRKGLLSAAFWSDKLMDWAMKDHDFKVQLFRFIDAFPTLKTPDQIYDHLLDYMSQPGVTPPPGMNAGLKAGGIMKGTVAKTMSSQITGMAKKFIAGTNAESALPQLKKLWKQGMGFSVDLLGEACVSDAEALVYQNRYLDLVNNLPEKVAQWKPNEKLESNHLGPIPRCNVSIKITSLFARTNPIDNEGSIQGLIEALTPILQAAAKNNVLINFDMEHFGVKDLTLELFERCCEKFEFPAGLAMQAYLRSGDADAERIVQWSKKTGRQVTVRLIKGAYWDAETIHAEEMGWPVPIWSRKVDTDACFERMASQFIEAIPHTTGEGGIHLALGSHNVRSIAHSMALLEKHNLPVNALELQMLHGMGDDLKAAAVDMGLRIREYVPVGDMLPGMAYFVRRLLENTSNESWLMASNTGEVDVAQLLADPASAARDKVDPGEELIASAPQRHQLSNAVEGVGDGQPFFNESFRDFSQKDQRDAFGRAVATAKVPHVEQDFTEEMTEQALERSVNAFQTWRDEDPIKRANILVKAASIMRDRRDELSGVMCKEGGKPWDQADADVCEAIDFCDYYARQSPSLFTPQRLGQFIGELDQQWYQPRGVAVVISPWNFPLAICCGMTVAALVTGNTVLVKPSRQTPGIAKLMVDILHEAGCPKDVLQFVAGPGRTVGAKMIRDRRVNLIAFTGSKEVGLDILQAAGVTPADQLNVKKVICEMGGKNAIIIDASADLDEAVLGVRYSAFGYSGQKCSACSRVIVVDTAYDQFLERIVGATKTLKIGEPTDPSTDVGPVIDESAAKGIREYIEIGKSEGKLELACEVPGGLEEKVGKPYIGPHIFSGIESHHRIAQEEIFGPVLAVMRARDFDHALEIANNVPFKLTGAVFSRKPAHLEKARREFRVGNLYLNRGSTGALVGRQPFGGFGMSGVGTKAGGVDYLMHFVEPRTCCENTMRRGFAPELNS